MIKNKIENNFRTLYEGIVSRIEQHPKVELRGTSLDRGPFADINVNLYAVPYNPTPDASKLNEMLYKLKPEDVEPTESLEATVNDEFHFLSYGILGFRVNIGRRMSLRHTISTAENLLEATDDGTAIEEGIYTTGIRLFVVPHEKLVYQNSNGVWVVHGNEIGRVHV